VRGYCFGGAMELAAACDLRIASADARFGMPEVRLGIPSVVEAAILPMLIGWGRARRLLLTGETIDAARALAWGLVEEIAPAETLDAAVERCLADILACGAGAIRQQKALIQAWERLPLADAVAAGVETFAEAYRTDGAGGAEGERRGLGERPSNAALDIPRQDCGERSAACRRRPCRVRRQGPLTRRPAFGGRSTSPHLRWVEGYAVNADA
jgi:enoyl-CoA hydratase/carnithine racemase